MTTVIEKPGMHYTLDDNNIHHFVFTNESDEGGEQFFDLLLQILKDTPPDTVIKYLVDTTQNDGRVKMGELVQRFRQLEAKLPDRAAGRTAILHNGSIMLTLANTIIDTFAPAKDKTRFFEASKRDEAYLWLLNE